MKLVTSILEKLMGTDSAVKALKMLALVVISMAFATVAPSYIARFIANLAPVTKRIMAIFVIISFIVFVTDEFIRHIEWYLFLRKYNK